MNNDDELLTMAEVTNTQFIEAEKKFCLVESCTGGLLAGTITSMAGSSNCFERGYVTYSNQAKMDCVNVLPETLDEFGAVSMQCAIEMAIGGLNESNADACVSITGIAGPGGGNDDKKVGLVFIAVANNMEPGAFGEEFNFTNLQRNEVQVQAAKSALEMLLAYGLENPDN